MNTSEMSHEGQAEDDDDPGVLPLVGALLLFAGFGPALGVTGFWPVFDLGVVGGIGVSAVGAGVGGAILGRTNRGAGGVCGALIGAGVFIAALVYTSYVRTQAVWNWEVVLVGCVGAAPGGILWSRLSSRAASSDGE